MIWKYKGGNLFEMEIVLPTSVVTAVDLPFMLAWVYLESSQHRTILDLLLDYHQSARSGLFHDYLHWTTGADPGCGHGYSTRREDDALGSA